MEVLIFVESYCLYVSIKRWYIFGRFVLICEMSWLVQVEEYPRLSSNVLVNDDHVGFSWWVNPISVSNA